MYGWFRYQLPVAGPEGLSPLFEGLPGKAAGKNTAQRPWSKLTGLNAVLNVNLWQKVCATVTALAIKFIEGESFVYTACHRHDLGDVQVIKLPASGGLLLTAVVA